MRDKVGTSLATRMHPRLPVFRLTADDRCVLYAPGYLAVATPAEAAAVQSQIGAGGRSDCSRPASVAAQLRECAEHTVDRWREWREAPFAPECLTVYLSNECNLACPYCFAAATRGPRSSPVIDEEPVSAAARLVSGYCTDKDTPLRVVLHGGGEPTVHWDLVQRLVAATRRIAEEGGVGWWGYIATNGVLPEARARWLAEELDLIGLSCDGPADIQDRQRPLPGGGASSAKLERTARVLADAGGRFAVRTTITPETTHRQAEIVTYLHERLGATQMRFEPLYRIPGMDRAGFRPADAGPFVEHFLAAQARAQALGCELSFSGARLDEVHGPYCNVLRDVLHLTPDGAVTGCFFCCDGRSSGAAPIVIGRWDRAAGRLVIDRDRIGAMQRRAAQIPDRCHDCVNAYHCARECPESCLVAPARTGTAQRDSPGFRCLVQRKLAEAWILQAAGLSVPDRRQPGGPVASRLGSDDRATVAALVAQAPPSVDAASILHEWEAVSSRYSFDGRGLPLPVWAQRGFEHDGAEAWRILSHDFPGGRDGAAMSLYVHVPFCDRRCGFCDCYSVPLRRSRQREDEYARALLADVAAWAGIEPLCHRPVTTVHFGGGTPNHLTPAVLARVVDGLRAHFHVTSGTEWALESTSSLLTDQHLEWLRALGFSRLHVGVQTLEEPLRRRIGRRGTAESVLERLARAIDMDFVVSVDMIYGLPGDTLPGFVMGLERLIDAGVHGFSLYQLQVSRRNRRFLERRGLGERQPLRDYVLFQVGEQLLRRHGYGKTHFTHFARAEDKNLYYTHPQRGEDLLALGPTADGVFGSYHYRYREHEAYTGSAETGLPVLEGGIWESAPERAARPLITALMMGTAPAALVTSLGAEGLLDRWLESALVEEGPEPGQYVLTANGSWFVTSMIAQVGDAVARSA